LYKIPANTLFTGQKLIFVPECHSTNTLASELASQSALPEGTVVITPNQTAGRGQRGNSWESAAGANLTLSIVVNPSFLLVRDQFYLTMITSSAVAECVRAFAKSTVKIKWPNDVLLSQKKICGILIENSLRQNTIHQSIVGIGLNVNQKSFAVETATSLSASTGNEFDPDELLDNLLSNFEKRYLKLRAGKRDEIKREYMADLLGLNEPRTFIADDKKFSGTIQDVNEDGELVMSVDGRTTSFKLKEISFVL
jgi:BirA family biotin operon repressor/biotin-[acetyl-CoA-carboxylase] ligase